MVSNKLLDQCNMYSYLFITSYIQTLSEHKKTGCNDSVLLGYFHDNRRFKGNSSHMKTSHSLS